MWRSVVTCIPVQIKPISKRSQHTIEDIEAFEQEQSTQDSTSHNRPVLPNIRPIPKSKFVYKGLAYKGVKKIPGLQKENAENTTTTTTTNTTTNTDSLKKPLIEYNLAQAYIRCEVNAERTKHMRQQPSLPPTSTAKNPPLTKSPTSLDLRETRKRIVKGTTFPYRPTTQSTSWISGRIDNKSAMSSEVFLSVRGLTPPNKMHRVSPIVFLSPFQQPTHIRITF